MDRGLLRVGPRLPVRLSREQPEREQPEGPDVRRRADVGALIKAAVAAEYSLDLALEVAHATPSVSVAVLDLVMPVLGGVEALALLREHDPSLRYVLTTGYAIPWEQRELLTDPSIVLLRKPYSVDQLAAAVRASLERA